MLQKRRVAGKLIHVLMVATCDESIQCWVRPAHCRAALQVTALLSISISIS